MRLSRVSVILPVFNAATTIAETLNSINQQSFKNYELIVIDDGSSDDSAAIIQAYADCDPRVRLYRQKNLGVVAASNKAIALANTQYIARMDADDLMHPDRLQRQFDYLEKHPEIALVGCQVNLFPEDAVQGGFREYIRWQNSCLSAADMRDERYVELMIANPTIFCRREVIQACLGYREGAFPEDYDLLLRLAGKGYGMAKIDEPLLEWRDSESRLTRTDKRYSRESFDRLRALYLGKDARLHTTRSIMVWGAGRKSRKRASLLMQYGIRFAAWIDVDVKKIGNKVQNIPVVSADVLKTADRPFVLIYVNNHGMRDLIADDLHDKGYCRGDDYLMVG